MNDTYRAAMIHGLLAYAAVLGFHDYQDVYEDGVKCRLSRGRQETVYQLSADFARYLWQNRRKAFITRGLAGTHSSPNVRSSP
jgi:hypothetical protein